MQQGRFKENGKKFTQSEKQLKLLGHNKKRKLEEFDTQIAYRMQVTQSETASNLINELVQMNNRTIEGIIKRQILLCHKGENCGEP